MHFLVNIPLLSLPDRPGGYTKRSGAPLKALYDASINSPSFFSFLKLNDFPACIIFQARSFISAKIFTSPRFPALSTKPDWIPSCDEKVRPPDNVRQRHAKHARDLANRVKISRSNIVIALQHCTSVCRNGISLTPRFSQTAPDLAFARRRSISYRA